MAIFQRDKPLGWTLAARPRQPSRPCQPDDPHPLVPPWLQDSTRDPAANLAKDNPVRVRTKRSTRLADRPLAE